ncbi:ABC transporter substrate-binding protein [Maridesulfovibrio zosterae]|uniref:ABC transporter substrate-binding protein n=1 Tax=Maridesulfovibrio zosterae TaxID=82171 RepID=UPI0003F62765|nr:ABC transporter substrate-binding protein [Maridesulfovibrio zosterae]
MILIKKILVPLLMILIVSFSIACTGDKKSAAPELKVGIVAVTSGELFRKGNYLMTAARYAADKVNKLGGINVGGAIHKVKLISADTGGRSEIAAKVAKRLIEKDKVAAIVGGTSSEVAMAVARVCEKYSVPFITPVAGTIQLTSLKYSFRVSYTNKVQSRALARFVATELHRKSVGVLYSAGAPYSTELASFFKKKYEKIGGKVTAFESYASGARKYKKQLKKILDSGAEILFLPNNTKKIQLQAAQARKMGFKGILLGGDSWDPIDLERNNLFMGSYFADHWVPGLPSNRSKEFEKDFKTKNGVEPTELEALTYDAMMSLFAAVKEVSSINSVAIHDGLISMPPFYGVTGTFDYNNNGDPDKDVIISTIRDGHIAVSNVIPVQ